MANTGNFVNPSNKLIVREGKRMSGLVDTNHLKSYLDLGQPEIFQNALKYMFTQRQIPSNPILELTEGRKQEKRLTTESDAWTWKLAVRPLPSRSVEDVSGATYPGLARTPFKIKLDQDWFRKGEVLTPDKNSGFQARVSSFMEPYKEGAGWVYLMELITDNDNDYLPTVYLVPGVEWVSLFNMYGERAVDATEMKWDANIQLMNSMPDMIRHKYVQTGYVEDMVLTITNATVDPASGNPIEQSAPKWITRAEMKFFQEFEMKKENSLFYGRGSNYIKDNSGYNVRTPYGFKQQLEWGNVETYNTFTLKMLSDWLAAIFFGRVPMENRDIQLLTGEYGFRVFDEAVKREANGLFLMADKFTTGSGMDMGYGFQFRSYNLINGGKVTLRHLPSLDVNVTNSGIDRTTGIPRESATFYALELGGDLMSNMQIVKPAQDAFHWGYKIGTRAPWALKGSVISDEQDGYTLIARDRVGLHIEDITMTGVLKMGFTP